VSAPIAYTPEIYAGSTIGLAPTAGNFTFNSGKTAGSNQSGYYIVTGKLIHVSATVTWINVSNMSSIVEKIADVDIRTKPGFYITLPRNAAKSCFIYGGLTFETSSGTGADLAGSKYESIIGKTTAGTNTLHLFSNEKEPKPFDYDRPFGAGKWATSKGSTLTFTGIYEEQ
jgi:hypothetical protein